MNSHNDPRPALQCAGRVLDLSIPRVMGVLNTTPDSFSDGGQFYADAALRVDAALRAAGEMVAAGAAIIDVGGESTRPGATPVSTEQELERVIPVIAGIAERLDVVISVDTSSPVVMREAAAAGAGLINDVRALTRDGALEAAAATGLPVCVMHMQGSPDTMQARPEYADAVTEICDYLLARAAACEAAGIARGQILLDPGFGFGKTLQHNLDLLRSLPSLAAEGYPVLAGLSRKSMIGQLTGREVGDRLAGSITLAVLAAERGARILRVHDVAQTVDALAILRAVEGLEDA